MPNLVGIHDPTAGPEELARDLARMMAAVDLPSFRFIKRSVVSAHIGCGNVLTGVEDNLSQPARDEARGLWLMLDGEILNASELAKDLAWRGSAGERRDDAEIALAMYVAFGMGAFERLNGQWNIVLHDRSSEESLLVSDRLGSRIVFYAEDGPRFTFASEAKAVVAGRRVETRIGGLGLIQLLSAGSHHGDRTWLEGIRVLDPGTIVRLGAGRGSSGRRRTRYFRLRFRESGPDRSEDDYADAFGATLKLATERAMRRRPQHPIAITLSGGLDSRAVALAIPRGELPITSLTYGAPESADAIYAAQLAQLLGLDHHHIEGLGPALVEDSSRVLERLSGPSPSGRRGFYSAQLDRVAWRSESMSVLYGSTSMIWHPLYRRYMRLMLNGACGDAMTGSHLTPNLLLEPTRRQVIERLRRQTLWQSPELVKQVLQPAFQERLIGELDPGFDATFDAIDADEPMAIANVWDMENRQRRGAFATFTIERYFCTCRSPFLDDELVDLLADVPPLWRFQQRVYKRMLVRSFPEARQVPWAYTGGPITASPIYEFCREALQFAQRRIRRALPARKARRAHWNFRDEVTMMREDRDLGVAIESFVRSDYFPDDVLSPSGVRQLVEDFNRGPHPRESEMLALYAHLVGIAKCSELFLAARGPIAVTPAADPAAFGVDTSP